MKLRWSRVWLSSGTGALLLSLCLVIASTLAMNINLRHFKHNRDLVGLTNQILHSMVQLQTTLRAAETGQRGYLLTGERRYLAPYEQAVAQVSRELRELDRLVRHPLQRQRLEELTPLIEAKLAELARTIELRSRGTLEQALRLVNTDEGQRLTETLDARLHALNETERELLEERSAREEYGAMWTTQVAAITGGLALISGLLGVFWLVRQRAQLYLQASEERFRQLAENIQEVFWIADPAQRRMLYANPAFEKIWRQPREVLYQDPQQWLKPIPPDDRTRVEVAHFDRAASGGFDEIYRVQQPDDLPRWIRDRGWPVRDEAGNIQYTVGVAEDITEIKYAQDALMKLNALLEHTVEARTARLTEVNKELEAFAYTISHDLRAPLRAMHGYADVLMEDFHETLSGDGQLYTRRIAAAAERMEALIEDLLAYSRLAREEIKPRPVSLDLVVSDAVSVMRGMTAGEGPIIEIQQPLIDVMAHPGMLRQSIDNLLSNAIKFVAPGVQPRVLLRAERQGDWVRLWVEDNGIGIEPAHQQRIFRVFERLHGVEAYPGTGIGLAIVRKSVERMGGRCGVDSAPGQGSRFWIELRAASASRSRPRPEEDIT